MYTVFDFVIEVKFNNKTKEMQYLQSTVKRTEAYKAYTPLTVCRFLF